ncbi:ABC transporter permease [Marisediminicola sp. LYQ85]|uniref:ABC transporter permease n=1 Tax=Marisediminicola sp. LYQ85 TaxID=3391062 RepID=UPI003982F6B3
MTQTTLDPPVTPAAVPTAGTGELKPQGMAGRTMSKARIAAIGIPLPIVLGFLWHFGVTMQWELPFGIRMSYLPTPFETAERLWDLAFGGIFNDTFSGALWIHLWASTQRVLYGFLLAAAFAIPLGVLMGRFKLINRIADPTVNLIRPIPVTAWAPLSLLIIGFGDQATIFLIFLAAFFPILLNTITAVMHVSPRLLEAAAMLGISRLGTLLKVVVPASAPGILGGLRIGLGLSWVILVVGETVGINIGLGSVISQARDTSRTDLIVSGMIIIGLAGFLSDRIMVGLIKLGLRGRPLIR